MFIEISMDFVHIFRQRPRRTPPMAQLPFQAFDADHHYYEAEDAFIRHVDPRMRRRCMQWAVIDGRKRLLVGGKINRFIPNPTFDPVARPGVLDQYFRGRNPEAKDMRALFGELEPISPAYRDRDARLTQMDAQGLAGAFFFPTLGVGMEESLRHDPEALLAAFRGFNRWMDEDWGFAYQGRVFAAPYITLMDPQWAADELEWALSRDVRLVCMRPGPVAHPGRHCSPGHPRFDAFWARAAEAGITVAYHSGDAGYLRYSSDWGMSDEFKAFAHDTLQTCLSASPIRDTLAALICHGVFERHPNLRVATIETGSEWAAPLVKALKKAYGQAPRAFRTDPVESFRRHVWVSPYYEDDLERLKDLIGADHVLFGSDFPHAEGLAEPTDFLYDLKGYDEDEVRLSMRENALGLTVPRPI
jgi:predicted TIM-barrel fold metal-dependent hydrolase